MWSSGEDDDDDDGGGEAKGEWKGEADGQVGTATQRARNQDQASLIASCIPYLSEGT